MGRNAGWLVGAAALSKGEDCDGPDLIYVPELPFDIDNFLVRIKELLAEKTFVVVAVSEGIRLAESSVNPAGLRLKRHMDKLAPRFRRRSPARSSFRFSARRSDCTLWLCRRLCGVELCGARQDSGPPRAEAVARAALRRCNVATECAGFSKA